MFNRPRRQVPLAGVTQRADLGISTGIRTGQGGNYGTPLVPSVPSGRQSPASDVQGNTLTVTPPLVMPWPLMVQTAGPKRTWHGVVKVNQAFVALGARMRGKGGRGITWPGGVAAQTPQTAAVGYLGPQKAIAPQSGTVRANVINPLFGRPGFTYATTKPSYRSGPIPKLAPGTGETGKGSDRSSGVVAPGFASQQFMPMTQFDYMPLQDSDANSGTSLESMRYYPRNLGIGTNGRDLVGTYDPHDFTPADRFFKQGRSSSNWQDMSFGPQYRYLQVRQQVVKYNLQNSVALSRQLSPNNYFLGYQQQPGVLNQMGGATGMGRPLGYGAS